MSLGRRRAGRKDVRFDELLLCGAVRLRVVLFGDCVEPPFGGVGAPAWPCASSSSSKPVSIHPTTHGKQASPEDTHIARLQSQLQPQAHQLAAAHPDRRV